MEFSINLIFEDDFKINQTKLYLCNELNTKLIYESLQNLEVIGIASSINGKIVEVISHKIKNKKDYYKIKINNSVIGWMALENSPRVYRIPKVTGKILSKDIKKYNDLDYELSSYVNKLLETRFYFEEENQKYCLINRIGHRELNVPVLITDFYKYDLPRTETYIELEKGEKLLKSSTSHEIVGEVEIKEKVKVIGFYKELDELKIKRANKSFWIKRKVEFSQEDKGFAIGSLELIDQIMFLKANTYLQKLEIDSQEKKIQKIKENIAISNDLQQLYLTKYLGDQNDIE